jgi:hypothetical protein
LLTLTQNEVALVFDNRNEDNPENVKDQRE